MTPEALAQQIIDAIPEAMGITPDPWPIDGQPDPRDGQPHKRVSDIIQAALTAAETERDGWRNERHSYEARLFHKLYAALNCPDDKSAEDMIDMLLARLDARGEAGGKG